MKVITDKASDLGGLLAAYSHMAQGFVYAADHGANVINLSAGGSVPSASLKAAVDYAFSKGVIVVTSGGNTNSETPSYPAAYPNIIAVGATNSVDRRAVPFTLMPNSGSSPGSQVAFVAPGDLIIGLSHLDPEALSISCGTSFSAPMVSGTVTLLLSINPHFSFEQVYGLLKAGARDQVGLPWEDTKGWDKYYGWGRIDAYRSLLAAYTNNSPPLSVAPGGVALYQTAGINRQPQAGYATGDSESGIVPYGLAVFSFRQNGVTVAEAGVPASPPTTAARIFVDFRSDTPGNTEGKVNTGIGIVNCGFSTANVVYTLRDLTGTILSSAQGTIDAGAHFAKFIDQIKEVAPDFSLPSDYKTTIRFGSLEIAGDQPLSILALRQTTNSRGEALFTTTPAADLTQPLTSAPIYFPQFADGGGYTPTLVLLNTSDKVEVGTFQILGDNGVPFAANPLGGTSDSRFQYSIPPGGTYRFQTDGIPTSPNVGWIRLKPDAGTSTPVGAGIFSYSSGGILVSEAGVPAASPTTHARVYVDLSGNHNTGLAVANPADTESAVTIKAFQSDGVTEAGAAQGDLRLAGKGHNARFATELISELPAGFAGVLDVQSASPFVALTIRSLINERSDFLLTTFPIADQNSLAPSPVIFPQIADGGGFVTQFILLGTGAPSSTVLRFHADDGSPLLVGLADARLPFTGKLAFIHFVKREPLGSTRHLAPVQTRVSVCRRAACA